jgi:hypothetical protein
MPRSCEAASTSEGPAFVGTVVRAFTKEYSDRFHDRLRKHSALPASRARITAAVMFGQMRSTNAG